MTTACMIESVALDTLLEKARAFREQGWRVVQISATRLADAVEITYSFDLNGQLRHLRLLAPGEKPRVPSLSGVFPCVILYENEIHDLFGVVADGLAVDFHGKFYQTAVKFPFGSTKPPAAPAAGAAPAAETGAGK